MLHVQTGLPTEIIIQYSIYNLLGFEIYSRKSTKKDEEIDISTLNPGIYWLKVQVEKEFVARKFVIQH